MASSSVEAASLSDITQLASNPPKYPRNPTEQKRQPLILYIARVPGSRDVILTTLKPQLKNVTAQDVASSLYYFHVNTEDDLRLLDDTQANTVEENGATSKIASSMQKPLPRKPLSETARGSLDPPPQTDFMSRRMEARSMPTQPVTTPVERSQHSIRRRPVQPSIPTPDPTARRQPVQAVQDETFLSSDHGVSDSRISMESTRSSRSEGRTSNQFSTPRGAMGEFSITIIRRDPSSGAQWNIGSVTGHPTTDENIDYGSRSPSKSKKPYFDLSIHLTAPGYAPFRDLHPSTAGTAESYGNASKPAASKQQPEALPPHGFHRQVRMEGSSFWARTSMQHKRTASDLSAKSFMARGRSASGSSAIEVPDATNRAQHKRHSSDESSGKGYMFSSPWGGRCKFSTGSGGRTLRCRHSLPSPIVTSDATNSMATPQASAPVSELRFNLPSSDVFASWASQSGANDLGTNIKRFARPRFENIRDKLSSEKPGPPLPPRPNHAFSQDDEEERPPLPPRSNHTLFANGGSNDIGSGYHPENAQSNQTDFDSRFDLSLGQEKAGGGNRGKRAKLGKLVVHDEGFKMLDLLVAANMGVWWSVWEADFR
ncbi:hypothetical protein BJ875DRAFT_452573 [Amylocarpus encephaloides]|uniref:Oxidoreductase-like protein n=1 Tax=Amylocarpus encephaloides TaxID=45428 RepID=A0A9P7YQF1_9HELO|nr:hypothetical protein BJ875DRAFT_452573 [Amylocarpus encephaloides]